MNIPYKVSKSKPINEMATNPMTIYPKYNAIVFISHSSIFPIISSR